MTHQWVLRSYKDGECTCALTTTSPSLDEIVYKVNRGHVSGKYKQFFEVADFICVQPIGNMFAERLQQLEQESGLSRPRVKSRLCE